MKMAEEVSRLYRKRVTGPCNDIISVQSKYYGGMTSQYRLRASMNLSVELSLSLSDREVSQVNQAEHAKLYCETNKFWRVPLG